MAKSASMTLALTLQGDGLTLAESVVLTNAASSPPTTVALASGNNTIVFPSGVQRVLIVPPVGNAVVMALKDVAGDTGIPISLTEPQFLSLTFTQFIINANAPVTVTLYWC
jgi:hypothetical protein